MKKFIFLGILMNILVLAGCTIFTVYDSRTVSDISICDKFTGKDKIDCITNVATNTNNIELCDNPSFKPTYYIGDCYEKVAAKNSDCSICMGLKDVLISGGEGAEDAQSSMEGCLNSVVQSSKPLSFECCKSIETEVIKFNCQRHIVFNNIKENKDMNFCTELENNPYIIKTGPNNPLEYCKQLVTEE